MRSFFIFTNLLFFIIPVFSQIPGDMFFGSAQVHRINIQFSDSNYWTLLLNNYDRNMAADSQIYIRADLTIDNLLLSGSGVRLKGNSTITHPGQKKPMKLSFNEFNPGQSFNGMKQMNLHNGFLDATMMREKLLLDFLNMKGLPAPRCTYAEVFFNNSYVGLFKAVEEVDKKFLKTRFGNNTGNLFKGEPRGTLEWNGSAQWNYYDYYELKTNENRNDWDDLVDLLDVINHTPRIEFMQKLNNVFNAEIYLKIWAANNLFVNLDSYYYQPHNYYLYHNELTGRFEWIAWDVGTAFGVFPLWKVDDAVTLDPVFSLKREYKRPLNQHLFEIDDCRNIYFSAYCDFLYNDFRTDKLFPVIDSIAGRIRPFLYAEPDSNQMFSEQDFERNINYVDLGKWWYSMPALKSFIEQRRDYLVNRLCELEWSCSSGMNIKGIDADIVRVFPNPSQGRINIKIEFIEPETYFIGLAVIDVNGKEVCRSDIPVQGTYSGLLDLSSLPRGLYLVCLQSGCRRLSRKIILN